MATVNLLPDLATTTAQFHQAAASTQLAVLYYLARKIHQTSTVTTPSAFFSQRVHEVLRLIRQLPKNERREALEDILHGGTTRLTEVYGRLDANMRMAFWYRLANSPQAEALLPLSLTNCQTTPEHERLLADLEARDSNELVSILWAVVAASPENVR